MGVRVSPSPSEGEGLDSLDVRWCLAMVLEE